MSEAGDQVLSPALGAKRRRERPHPRVAGDTNRSPALRLFLLLLTVLPCAADPLLFTYFKEPADMGVFFATSDDGYRWTPLNGGRPWLPVQHPGELMRDPFVTRRPDGEFHMVWTWAWRGPSIGYAHSPDLVRWSDQQEIPLMAGTPGTANTWAPEIYWDGRCRSSGQAS